MYAPFRKTLSQDGSVDEAALREAFLAELQDQPEAEPLFDEAVAAYEGEELVEICGEIVQTIKAECTADDFHNWNYDHLEFIIDLSNRHNFIIPRNLLNGLPEQLIILVDSKKLSEPGCD
ncbi:MAG: hypothetical protein ACOCYB_09210 [Alkalispirochaeta sp.]